MGKTNHPLQMRLTALLLAFVCVFGLFPEAAFAASDTITLKDFGHSGVAYQSAALGRYTLHEMTFKNGSKDTIGFCGTKGGGMGSSLRDQTWGRKTSVSNSAVETMMAYYYAHSTGVFTDAAKAIGANDVWDSGYTWYMNAWVQACIWRWKQGSMGNPVVACAEELMAVYNTLEHTNYTNIDQERDNISFRDRTQFIFDLGAQGVWGKCAVYEYSFTGAGSSSHPASSVQKIILGDLIVEQVDQEEYSLLIKKVDASNPGKALPGAGFHVESQNGSFTRDVITGQDGTCRVGGLSAGTYVVTETSAPEGYEIDSAAPQYVTLPSNGNKTVTVTFRDSVKVTGEGSIRKVDADDPSKGLAGAVIKITGVDNSFTGTYTTSEGGYLTDVPWDKIPIGSYIAEEITPPTGYAKSPDQSKVKQSFHWNGKDDVALIFENDANVKVQLLKLDDSNKPLPGAVFNIIKNGQIIGTEVTDENGNITITDVTEGMYAFIEVSAPAPYARLTEPVIAHVDQATINGGGTVTVTASDKKLPNLTILKRDAKTGDVIPNTNFEIKGIHYGYHNDVTTGADGKAVLTGIPSDSYEVTEISVPDPYVVSEEPTQTIWLEAGDSKELIFDNQKQPTLKICKIEKGTNVKIPGTVFTVEGVDSDYRQDVTTEADGAVTLRVMPGSYRITEKSVPEPYVVSDEPTQTISLNPGDEKELIFENQKQPLLRIAKIEKGTGNKIPGTIFLLEAIDGDYRQNVTTDTDGWAELRVAPGSYRITEQSVPEPYVIGEERTKTISLNPGDEKEITFENLKKPELTLYKIDADSQKPVPGTVLRVEAINGDYQDDWKTGPDGKVTKYVEAGTYRITEISVPAPYYLPDKDADRVQTISLNPGDEKELVFKNQKAPEFTIFKEDSVAGAPIEGARFHVTYTSNGEAADAPASIDFGHFITDVTGEIKLHEKGKKLYPGEYTVTETAPAPGFQMKEPTTQKVIIRGGESKTVTFQNEPLNAIVVEKYDSVTGEALPGCTFQLRYLGGTSGTGGTVIGQKVTGKNGTAIWTSLKPGTYIVEEVNPADGYSIINSSETVYLADSGEQSVVTVRFDNAPDGTLLIRKVCSVNPSITLANAEFKITYSDGTLIGDGNGIYMTDENGEIRIPGLKPGKSIIVTEVKAPPGFLIDTQSQTIQVKEGRTVTLTFKNQPKGELIVQKRDSITGQPLPGAEFRITTAAGCEVGLNGVIGSSTLTQNGIFTTDGNGAIRITNLAPGAYILTEIKAPDGYVMDSPSTNVVIGSNGDTQTVVIKNTLKGNLVVEKYDSVTKQPLAGARFKITNANGELTSDNEGLTSSNGLYTTDYNGQIVLSKLLPGTYIVTEEKAPDNYRKDPTPQTVVVNAGDTQTLRFYDDPLCSLTILKRDSVTKKPLANAEFYVRDSEGKTIGPNNGLYITGAEGTVTVSGLQPNATIIVSESKAPAGYILNETPKNIVVRSGAANSLIFDDEPGTTLVIHKYIEGTENEPLSGAAFKVVDGSGAAVGPDDGVYFTDKSGEIVLSGIEPGTTVKVREIKTVDGFVLDGTPQDILIKAGEAQQLTFWNKRAGTLVIQKKDKVSGALIAGAEFQLTYANGGYVDNNNGHLSSNGIYTTNDKGEIRISGVVGTIVVKETKPAPGYVIDQAAQTQTVTVNPMDTQTLTFLNDPLCSLTLTKLDSVTGKPVPGTEFTVKDGNGSVLGRYTTGKDGTVLVTGLLPNSTVVVTETKVPKGYVLNPNPQTIIVKNGSGNIVTSSGNSSGNGNGSSSNNDLTFENDPTTTLVIQKVADNAENTPLAGVEFLVTDGTGAVVGPNNGYYTTDKDGRITIANLEPGTVITAKETRTLDGYILDNKPQSITIKTGEVQTLVFRNQKLGGLIINKIDSVTKKPLAGVKFKITYADGLNVDLEGGKISSNGIYTTDTLGQIKIPGITGTIIVTEIEAPSGYVIDPAAKSQTIQVNTNDTQIITFENTQIGGLELIKVSESDKNQRIPNVKFEIRKMDGALVKTVTTDSTGRVHAALDSGDYYAVEIEAAKGFKSDSTPHYFTVKDAETTTLTVTNKAFSGIMIHKVDSITKKGIYGVTFLLYDSTNTPIGQYTSDNSGYVYIEGITTAGWYYLRELENKGYITDTEMKTVYVKPGETTLVEWENTPITGQIQITKKSADYNSTNGFPAGTLLEGAVFEIYDKASNLVDTIRSDSRGLAVSRQLPLGRYTIKETKAPANYGVNDNVLTAYLEHEGEIVRFEVTNKSMTTGVAITKTGPAEAMAGQPVRYVLSGIANSSNVRLDNFYWRDTLPAEVRLDKILTGTYNFPGTYKITYRVNGGEPRTLADSLSTQKNYTLAASATALGLASNERVTEVMFVFGQAPAGFAQVEKPMIYCNAVSSIATKSFVNKADVGGTYNGVWIQAVSRWVTKVYGKPVATVKLPRTGY